MHTSEREYVFEIKTEVFEGPLELLLELVEKRKLLINDISLASVTDEYMSQVAAMQEANLPNTAQFIQLAATLLLLKSKSLLPVLELTSDEEESIEDLEERLKRYQLYRDIAADIQAQFGRRIAHEREYTTNTTPLFVPDERSTLSALHAAMRDFLTGLPEIKKQPRAQVRETVSLADMMQKLERRIQEAQRTTLRELTADHTEHTVVIVGFLAILESVKQGTVLVAQLEHFADIEVRAQEMNTPQYY